MTFEKMVKTDYRDVKKLYLSAFPADERAPFFLLKRRAKQGKADWMIMREHGQFIGFAYIVTCDDLAYLFYLAVSEGERGHGYGSEILTCIKEHYCDKRIFLAREQLDENADNYDERLRRHGFYLKNGFVDLSLRLKEANVIYDLMGYRGTVTPEEYRRLIAVFTGNLWGKLVDMRIIA